MNRDDDVITVRVGIEEVEESIDMVMAIELRVSVSQVGFPFIRAVPFITAVVL